jgi:hypothetical protein
MTTLKMDFGMGLPPVQETPQEAYDQIVEGLRMLREDDDAGIEDTHQIVVRLNALERNGFFVRPA